MPSSSSGKKKMQMRLTAETKAVDAYSSFIDYVVGKVKKIGLEETLAQPENKWLRPHYERLLNFAEQCQLKRISVEKDADDEPMDKPFVVNIISSNDNAERKPV